MPDDEDYFLPSTDQRVFGAGLHRKKINFVPEVGDVAPKPQDDTASAYLAIVFKDKPDLLAQSSLKLTSKQDSKQVQNTSQDNRRSQQQENSSICTICGVVSSQLQPVGTDATVDGKSSEAEASMIDSNVCLHEFVPLAGPTPSHIDRTRFGHRILQRQGWNADSRKGVGKHSSGIAAPIKAKAKYNTAGLISREEQEAREKRAEKNKNGREDTEKRDKQNVRQARIHAKQQATKAARLRQEMFGDVEWEKLG